MKKQLKSGFTLAEVLITLAIIGIVAAIVMPSVITSYQFKTVGVKLAKFASTVENAARAYVVSNDSFKTTEISTISANDKNAINTFVNEAMIFKGILQPVATPSLSSTILTGLTGREYASGVELGLDGTTVLDDKGNETDAKANLIGVMKDNTRVTLLPLSSDADAADWETKASVTPKMGLIQKQKVGSGAFILLFDPNVTGLPKKVHKTYSFVVTELGYMYPAANDSCLWEIYSNDYTTNSKTFKSSASACVEK